MLIFKSEGIFLNSIEFSKKVIMALLLLFLVLYLFISTKIIWALYILFSALIIFARNKLTLKPVLLMLILSFPLLWSLIMSLNDDLILAVKGFFYLSVPLILIFIGYQFRRIFTAKDYFSYIVKIGTAIALVYITLTLIRVGFKAFISPYTEARFSVGSGSPACVLSLVIGLYSEKFGLKIFKNSKARLMTIIINLIAIYLFASRNYWVMLFLFILFFSFRVMKKETLIFVTVLFILFFVILSVVINARSGLTFTNSIIYKLVNSFSEIKMTDFQTESDINSFYRGYESYRSWITYSHGNIAELFFGGGYGKLIDLDAKILLDGKYWTEVPLVHNGFMFALVKEGALGLAANLTLFLLLINEGLKKFKSKVPDIQFIGILVLSCTGALFITNFVSCGFYNLEMVLLLITTGFLMQGSELKLNKLTSA
jgi:hypothetical protein